MYPYTVKILVIDSIKNLIRNGQLVIDKSSTKNIKKSVIEILVKLKIENIEKDIKENIEEETVQYVIEEIEKNIERYIEENEEEPAKETEGEQLAKELLRSNQKFKDFQLVNCIIKTKGSQKGLIIEITKDTKSDKKYKYFVKEFDSHLGFGYTIGDFLFQKLKKKRLKTASVDLLYHKNSKNFYVISLSADTPEKITSKNRNRTYTFDHSLTTDENIIDIFEYVRSIHKSVFPTPFNKYPFTDLRAAFQNIDTGSQIAFGIYAYIFQLRDLYQLNVGIRTTLEGNQEQKQNIAIIDSGFHYFTKRQKKIYTFLETCKEALNIPYEDIISVAINKILSDLLQNLDKSIEFFIKETKGLSGIDILSQTNTSWVYHGTESIDEEERINRVIKQIFNYIPKLIESLKKEEQNLELKTKLEFFEKQVINSIVNFDKNKFTLNDLRKNLSNLIERNFPKEDKNTYPLQEELFERFDNEDLWRIKLPVGLPEFEGFPTFLGFSDYIEDSNEKFMTEYVASIEKNFFQVLSELKEKATYLNLKNELQRLNDIEASSRDYLKKTIEERWGISKDAHKNETNEDKVEIEENKDAKKNEISKNTAKVEENKDAQKIKTNENNIEIEESKDTNKTESIRKSSVLELIRLLFRKIKSFFLSFFSTPIKDPEPRNTAKQKDNLSVNEEIIISQNEKENTVTKDFTGDLQKNKSYQEKFDKKQNPCFERS